MAKQTKVLTRRKKFIDVDIPLTNSKIELIGTSPKDIEGRTIKLDLTRQLKGKSIEAVVKIQTENEKSVARPLKIRLMPYFIRRIIRKRISYVEDSFETPSQENMLRIKPFLITRKRVSRAVKKTLRNKARNWIEDYIASRKNSEIFSDVLTNKLQRPLSLVLKKTYPLSFCEIRILELKRPLEKDEIPKIKPKPKESISKTQEIEEGLDQFAEIEAEKKLKAEEEIKETQSKASEKEKTEPKDSTETSNLKDSEKPKKESKKTTKKEEKIKEDTKEDTKENKIKEEKENVK